MFSRLASALAAVLPLVNGQFNNPPGVDIWCGKAYRDTYGIYSSFMATYLLTKSAMRLSIQVAGSKNLPGLTFHWSISKSDLE